MHLDVLHIYPPDFNHYPHLCPIAARLRGFGTSTLLPQGLAVSGEVLNSHVRSIDTEARPIGFAGQAPAAVLAEVRAKLAALMGIE